MTDKVTFELVSPDRLLMSVDTDMVAMPGLEGDFGVMPGHSPVISALRAGVIEVETGGDTPERIYIAGGFAEISSDRLVVLAEKAEVVAELTRTDIDQLINEANNEISAAEEGEQLRLAEGKLSVLQEMLSGAH